MKYFFIILIFCTTYVQAATETTVGCLDATRLGNDTDCNFIIESSQPGKVIIDPSLDLNQYHIRYAKATEYDEEGRPCFNPASPYCNTGAEEYNLTDKIIANMAKNPDERELLPIEVIDNGDKFIISDPTGGYYRIRLKNKVDKNIHWKQWVYIPFQEPLNARALAEKYMPIISFADNEEYFPKKIEDILSYTGKLNIETNIADEEKPYITDFTGKTTIEMGAPIIKFLTEKGESDFIINFGNGSYAFLEGDKNPSEENPVVYYSAITKGNFIYLSYFYFYSYDPKTRKENGNPGEGAHAFDRESLIITLDKSTQKPLSVTYGSHLASLTTEFLGCKDDDFVNCTNNSNKIMTVREGKGKLNWKHIHKQGNHPIAYAAKGSHALFPTYGWYKVVVNFALSNKEKAGNYSNQYTKIFKTENLIKLDNTSVFAFSGYWIDGAGAGGSRVGDSKFPPFIRYPENWAVKSNQVSDIDNCIGSNREGVGVNCPRLKKYFPHSLAPNNNTITLTGKVVNIPPNNDPLYIHYDGTTAEAIAESDGSFSLVIDLDEAPASKAQANGLGGDGIFLFSKGTQTGGKIMQNLDLNNRKPAYNVGTLNFNDIKADNNSFRFGGVSHFCPIPSTPKATN